MMIRIRFKNRIFQGSNVDTIIAKVPQSAVEEMCRYGASELHVIAALIGGIAAQEVCLA